MRSSVPHRPSPVGIITLFSLLRTFAAHGTRAGFLELRSAADPYVEKLALDRKLANRRIFPAIDIVASSTRRDDLLLDKDTAKRMWVLRKHMADMNSEEAINTLLKNMKGTKDNAEFLTSMNG